MLNSLLKVGLVAAAVFTPVLSLAAPASYQSLEQSPATLSDAQWVRLLDLAFKNDHATAKEAVGSSHNIRVKGMADDILQGSSDLAKKLQAVSVRTGVQAEDSDASRALSQRSAHDLQDLQATYGDEFDRVYLTQVIDAQYALITLLRQADQATPLADVRDQALRHAASHLLFAQQLRGDLGRMAD